jgi:hypothetical protein
MGKLVGFQHGSATVIPDCVSSLASQKTSLKEVSLNVCHLQTLNTVPCNIIRPPARVPLGTPAGT